MTRRLAALLLLPAALLGWALVALAVGLAWAHPTTAVLLVLTAGACASARRPRRAVRTAPEVGARPDLPSTSAPHLR